MVDSSLLVGGTGKHVPWWLTVDHVGKAEVIAAEVAAEMWLCCAANKLVPYTPCLTDERPSKARLCISECFCNNQDSRVASSICAGEADTQPFQYAARASCGLIKQCHYQERASPEFEVPT